MTIFEWLAKDLGQSVPAILNAAIPISNKNSIVLPVIENRGLKIKTKEAETIKRYLEIIENRRRAFLTTANLTRTAATILAYLHIHPNDRVAILVPGINEAHELAPYFSHLKLSIIASQQTIGQRFRAWQNFRQNQTRVMIGTHLASLLLPENLDVVFIIKSGSESHKQWDRNPRYDARNIVHQWQKINHGRLYFFDTVPRPEDFLNFTEEEIFISHPEPRPFFIDLNNERGFSPHPIISQTVYETIKQTLNQKRRVLCFYNRRGKATALRCSDCGQGFSCPVCGGIFSVHETSIQCHHCRQIEPLPLTCPNCRGSNLRERGFGNQTIKQELEKFFPNIGIAIVDKTSPLSDEKQEIILTTSYFLENRMSLSSKNFGLIINLDADLSLLSSGFNAMGETIHQLEDLRGLAIFEQALFLVQTRSRELLENYYNDPKNCLLKELELRQAYHQPPFVRYFGLKIRDKEERRAELELEAIAADFKKFTGLSILPIKCTKGRGCSLTMAVAPEKVSEVLEKIYQLSDRVVIDTNVIS
jgi:primosomal protein N' (replication factor Y)